MIFDYKYLGNSNVENTNSSSSMSFVPDLSRPKTFFQGDLNPLRANYFREAISALHTVVVDDQRYIPRDNSTYKAWRKEQDEKEILDLFSKELGLSQSDTSKILRNDWKAIQNKIHDLKTRELSLRDEQKLLNNRLNGYNKGLQRFWAWLYTAHKDLWFVLDPVITVHPEDVFFECFSQDESSYGKLSCNYNIFSSIDDFECGTTNIDYTSALYDEFQKIRSYKKTTFGIDPGGFSVATEHEDLYREVKVDLPDTWVRGFLQVSASMEMESKHLRLHPFDLHKICLFLRKHKEIIGPRALRFSLTEGAPPIVYIEPWNTKFVCTNSQYLGHEHAEIRVWGRRRIHILERLIPIAKHFDLHLLGDGQPYFFIADLGDMTFTLGLSSWGANNFSSAAEFDLLAPREDVSLEKKETVFAALKKRWTATVSQLCTDTNLSKKEVASSLTSYIQAGRVVFDLAKDCYQARELSRETLNPSELICTSKEEQKARTIVNKKQIGPSSEQKIVVKRSKLDTTLEKVIPAALQDLFAEEIQKTETLFEITAPIQTHLGVVQTKLVIDEDGRIQLEKSECSCSHTHNKTVCVHVLALRIQMSIPEDKREIGSFALDYYRPAEQEEPKRLEGILEDLLKKQKPSSKRNSSSKIEDEVEKIAPEPRKKKESKPKEKATTRTQSSEGKTLDELKEIIAFAKIKRSLLDSDKITEIISSLSPYKGQASYSAVISEIQANLMLSSSARKTLESAIENDDEIIEEIPEDEQDLSNAKVMFLGRFSGFSKSQLEKTATKKGASIADSIAEATIVVKGDSHISAKDKKILGSFDGETLDLDEWTTRVQENT